MTNTKHNRIKKIIAKIPSLTNGQLFWLERVMVLFKGDRVFKISLIA